MKVITPMAELRNAHGEAYSLLCLIVNVIGEEHQKRRRNNSSSNNMTRIACNVLLALVHTMKSTSKRRRGYNSCRDIVSHIDIFINI